MKTYLKRMLMFVFVVFSYLLVVNTAYAAIVDSVTLGENQGVTTVKGSLVGYNNQQIVQIYLLKEGKTIADIANMTDANLVFKHIGMTTVNSSGSYSYSFSAPGSSTANSLVITSGETQTVIPYGIYNYGETQLFVSPTGNDNSIGDFEHPLATFNGARNRVRSLRLSLGSSAAISVNFLPGEYRITSPIEFSASDAGTTSAPVVYRAFNDEKVVFKGSVQLDLNNLIVVTDTNILRRLPVSAVGKVYSMNLAHAGITASQVILKDDQNRDVTTYPGTAAGLGLYLNGKRQNLSRWPNYGYNKFYLSNNSSAIVSSGNSTTGAVFKYDTVNPSRWTEAKDMFIDGYLDAQYMGQWRQVSQIDTVNKTISLKDGVINSPSRRWTVVNLLEEIDAPGEYYIDKDTLMLFYYPAYTLNPSNDIMEYAIMQSPLVRFNRTSNIILKGLTFTQAYAQGIWGSGNSNIVIDGCTISDTRPFGITLTETGNTTIKNCTVYNIAGDGIRLNRNAAETDLFQLNYSNNRVINNHVYNVGVDIRSMGSGIACDGIGTEIKNNLVHASPNMAAGPGGAESVISYNEFYNLIRDTADAGGIYMGRQWNLYGVKYEFNYLHDFGIEGFAENEHTSGIFWDDTLSGQTASNNIIVNKYSGTAYGINANGGRDLTAVNNIFVGSNYPLRNIDFSNSNSFITNNQDLVATLKRAVESNSVYSAKYPQMMATYKEITDPLYAGYTGKFNPKNINFSNNVFALPKQLDSNNGVYVNGRMTSTFAPTVITSPNFISQSNDIFVDSENQDYRISNSGKVALGITSTAFKLDESFELSTIGLQNDYSSGLVNNVALGGEFKKTYPQNETVTSLPDGVELAWEQGLFADEYEYVVSQTPDLSNPVATGITTHKYVKIEGLTPGTVYYWNVTARHTSRGFSTEEYDDGMWQSSEGVYTFKTSSSRIYVNDLLAVGDSGNIRVQFNLNNIENSNTVSTIIMVCYNKDGIIKSINRIPTTIPALSKERTMEFSFSCDYISADYFTAFIWDGLNNIIPLVNDKIYAR